MSSYYGHPQDATDDSVVSHRLADLVSTRPPSARPTSLPARPPQIHTDQYNPAASYRSAQSPLSRSFPPSTSRSFDYPPPLPPSAYSSTPSLDPRYSYASLPRTLSGGYDAGDGTELDWVPSLDANPPERGGTFQGLGGDYLHGVGYEHSKNSTSWGAEGKKGKLSEEQLAKRIKNLQKRFGTGRVGGDGTVLSGEEKKLDIREGMQRMKEERERVRARERERSGVDDKGRLVVAGPKKRSWARWFQGLGAMAVGTTSIGASLLTRPKEKPPPSGTLPLIVLYILPFVSLLITVYLFVLRPCLYARKARTPPTAAQTAQFPGLYPLHHPPQPVDSGWCSCLGGGGGGGDRRRVPRGFQLQEQPTSINLIVDPSLFTHHQHRQRVQGGGEASSRRRREKRRKRKKKEAERIARQRERLRQGGPGENENLELLSSSSSSSSSSFASTDSAEDREERQQEEEFDPTNPRSFSSILSHVNLEQRWLQARKQVKWNATVDFLMGLSWGGIGIYAIGVGEKCPPGGFEGYCNLYNTSLAFSILLSFAFFASFTFDCLDLSRSKVSPRHRQQRLSTFSRAGRSRPEEGMV